MFMRFHIDYVLKLSNGKQCSVRGRFENGESKYFSLSDLYNNVVCKNIEPDNFIVVSNEIVKGKSGHALIFKELLSWDEVCFRYNKRWVKLEDVIWKIREGGRINYCSVVMDADSDLYWKNKEVERAREERCIWRWVEKAKPEVGVIGELPFRV